MGKKVPLILNNPGLLYRRLLIESADFFMPKIRNTLQGGDRDW